MEREKARFLHEVLGCYGVGDPDPAPPADIFIQSIDLTLRTQGAAWRFPDDATVESWGEPWADLTVEEIRRLDVQEAAHHPVVEAVLAQYRELARLYGDRADIFSLKSGVVNVHAPYTVAHQLCGEGLFALMAEAPEDAQAIFRKAWEIDLAIFARMVETVGARPTHLQLGDCSASLLSPAMYREVVLPVNRQIAAAFLMLGYHSCGASSHLLADFAALRPRNIQLGPGTDLAAAVRAMPGTHLEPLVDPVRMREDDPDGVREMTTAILRDTAPAPCVTLCAWSFDRDTPIENVAAMYESVLPQ